MVLHRCKNVHLAILQRYSFKIVFYNLQYYITHRITMHASYVTNFIFLVVIITIDCEDGGHAGGGLRSLLVATSLVYTAVGLRPAPFCPLIAQGRTHILRHLLQLSLACHGKQLRQSYHLQFPQRKF